MYSSETSHSADKSILHECVMLTNSVVEQCVLWVFISNFVNVSKKKNYCSKVIAFINNHKSYLHQLSDNNRVVMNQLHQNSQLFPGQKFSQTNYQVKTKNCFTFGLVRDFIICVSV